MSDAVTIRPASIDDASALGATIVAAFEQYRGKLTPESGALRETAETILAELNNGAGAMVAQRDRAILGCLMMKVTEGDLYFGRLSVLPAARGCGVARRLIDAVEADARRRGFAGVRLGVRIALPENRMLFASMGYAEIGRDAHPGFDHPTMLHMRKPL